MKKLRRIFVIGVMVLTAIGMSGVLATSPVSAAASAGDLIKMSGNTSVYYLGTDGKRYVFPNSTTYFSWYPDFSGVVTIPASELQSYTLGGNVTMRPGTKLVKITTDPSVYAVEPNGALRKIQSEAQAAALYGTNWSQRVVDVPDAFFTNYTVGAALASGATPVGSLVKNASGASVYYYDGTNYRTIASEAAFNANRFQWSNVLTAASTVSAGGTAISTAEFINVAQGGGHGPVATGSGVMVSLASDTPATQTIPAGVGRIALAKFNFTASNDGDAVVSSVTLTRTGLGSKVDFPLLWVEKDGVRITAQKAINSNDEALLTFAPALTIGAGKTVSLTVYGSVKSTGLGANDALSIKTASAIEASGATVSGSFPIASNLMSFTESYSVSSAAFAKEGGINTYTVGDQDVTVGSFSIAAGAKDLSFTKIVLKQTGNAELSQVLGDIFLEKSGVKVSESTVVDGKNITFVLANSGLTIDKSDSITFNVKASIIDRDTSNNTVILKLNKAEDLTITEVGTGYSATVTGAESLYTYTLEAGDITISKSSTNPTAKSYVKSTKNVVALIANVKANAAFTADGMVLTLKNTSTDKPTHFENIRLYVNGLLVDSVEPAADTDTTLTYTSPITINAGNNEVKVMLDVMNTAVTGDNIAVELASGNAFDTPVFANDDSATASIGGTATGAKVSVASASLTATRSDGFSAGKNIVKGTTDAVLGKFTLKALNDNITVNSVILSSVVAGSGTGIDPADVSGIKVMVADAQLGGTKDFTGSGATVNLGSDAIVIAKDTTKVVTILGTIESSADTSDQLETTVSFTGVDSSSKDLAVDPEQNTVRFNIAASGTLTTTKDGNSKIASLLAANKNSNEVAKFKLTATNDALKINKVYLSNVKGTGADNRISAINLYNGTTLLGTAVPTNGEVFYDLSSNPLPIEINGNVILTVKIDLNNIEEASQTNKDVQFAITGLEAESSSGTELEVANNALAFDDAAAFSDTTEDLGAAITTLTETTLTVTSGNYTAGSVIKIDDEQMLVVTGGTGVTSIVVVRGINGTDAATHIISTSIYSMSSVSANSFRIRKTVPTIALQTLPSTKLTAGNNTVLKFSVTADSNEDVTVGSFKANVSASVNTVQISTTGSVKVDGSAYTTATVTADGDNTTGNAVSAVDVSLTSPVVVAAGTSKTFEVVVNVTTLTGTDNNFVASIGQDADFDVTPDATNTFVWSDNSDVTSYSTSPSLVGSYEVPGLATDTQSLSN